MNRQLEQCLAHGANGLTVLGLIINLARAPPDRRERCTQKPHYLQLRDQLCRQSAIRRQTMLPSISRSTDM